jgi:hypothetical protein
VAFRFHSPLPLCIHAACCFPSLSSLRPPSHVHFSSLSAGQGAFALLLGAAGQVCSAPGQKVSSGSAIAPGAFAPRPRVPTAGCTSQPRLARLLRRAPASRLCGGPIASLVPHVELHTAWLPAEPIRRRAVLGPGCWRSAPLHLPIGLPVVGSRRPDAGPARGGLAPSHPAPPANRGNTGDLAVP